MAEIR
jgi:hypothetical protein